MPDLLLDALSTLLVQLRVISYVNNSIQFNVIQRDSFLMGI